MRWPAGSGGEKGGVYTVAANMTCAFNSKYVYIYIIIYIYTHIYYMCVCGILYAYVMCI